MITRRVLRCSAFKIKQVPGERATALYLSADRAQGDDAHTGPDHSPIFAWTKQNPHGLSKTARTLGCNGRQYSQVPSNNSAGIKYCTHKSISSTSAK